MKCYFCTVKASSDRRNSAPAPLSTPAKGNETKFEDGVEAAEAVNGPRLCSQFDAGRRFEVDCPLSTLCQSRTFSLHTHSGRVSLCLNVQQNSYC